MNGVWSGGSGRGQTGAQAETRGIGAYRCLVACCGSEDEAPTPPVPQVKSGLLPASLQVPNPCKTTCLHAIVIAGAIDLESL
jgi:hypothetical protein